MRQPPLALRDSVWSETENFSQTGVAENQKYHRWLQGKPHPKPSKGCFQFPNETG